MLFKELVIAPHLHLRIATTDFSDSLFELVNQEHQRLEQWMDWPKKIQTLPRCRRYLREMELMNQAGLQFFCFLFKEEKMVGSLALTKIDKENRCAELGFWKSQILGKTEMLSAAKAFVNACWNSPHLNRLEIQTYATNQAAKILSENLGFQLEGTKKQALILNDQFVDLDIYGLLRTDAETLRKENKNDP